MEAYMTKEIQNLLNDIEYLKTKLRITEAQVRYWQKRFEFAQKQALKEHKENTFPEPPFIPYC